MRRVRVSHGQGPYHGGKCRAQMKLENFSMQDSLLSVSIRARTAIFASRSPDGKAQTSSESGQNSLTGALPGTGRCHCICQAKHAQLRNIER